MKGKLLLRFLPVGVFFLLLAASILAQVSSAAGESTGIETELEEEQQEVLLNAKDGARLHLYDGEETAVLSSGGGRSLVTMSDKGFTRRLYDGEYRLASRLTWQEGVDTEPKDAAVSGDGVHSQLLVPPRLTFQEDYYYYENTSNRERVVLTDFQKVSRTESFFSPEGLLTRVEISQFVSEEQTGEKEDSDGKKDLKKKSSVKAGGKETGEKAVGEVTDLPLDPWKTFPQLTLTMRTEYRYDQENALVEKLVIYFEQDGKLSERTVYHQPGNTLGGYDFFENGQLLVSRKYEDENQYTETRYMDNMKIEARYNGARLVSETIYIDGKELRRTGE